MNLKTTEPHKSSAFNKKKGLLSFLTKRYRLVQSSVTDFVKSLLFKVADLLKERKSNAIKV